MLVILALIAYSAAIALIVLLWVKWDDTGKAPYVGQHRQIGQSRYIGRHRANRTYTGRHGRVRIYQLFTA